MRGRTCEGAYPPVRESLCGHWRYGDAEIVARKVVIQDSVTSKVVARQPLEVYPSGRFNGECAATSIEIRVGGHVRG